MSQKREPSVYFELESIHGAWLSGTKVMFFCRARGITQAQLAKALGITPVSFSQAVARNNFNMDYLRRIAEALDVSVVQLFELEATFKCPHCGHEIKLKIE